MTTDSRPDLLEERLRSTLHSVADTLTEDTLAERPAPAPRSRSRRWRRIGLGLGAVLVPTALAASAVVHHGDEYVDTIPPSQIVVSGEVDGEGYLLVESDRTDGCGNPVAGVELVVESRNLLGSEWDTSGYQYGQPRATDCGTAYDTSPRLRHPELYSSSGAWLGDSFVWVYAVHPDVTAVRIIAGDDTEDLPVHEVDGAGYAVYEIPENVDAYTSELLLGDEVVPGSQQEPTVHRP